MLLVVFAGCAKAPADAQADVPGKTAQADGGSGAEADGGSTPVEKGYIIGDEVRMRESGNINAGVLDILDVGTEVRILGKSESKQVAGRYEDYWYNIEYDGKTGWCFGEYVSSAAELQNRLKSRFDNFIKSGESDIKETADLLLKFAEMGADTDMLDEGVRRIMKLQEDSAGKYTAMLGDREALLQYSAEDLKVLSRIGDENLRKQLMKLKDNGYSLYQAEGDFYIEPDPAFLIKRFEKHISEPLAEFLKLKAIEVEKHFAADAALIITWDELSDRIAGWEAYIARYPEAPEAAQAREDYYRRYMFFYLNGIDNTGLYDYHTGILKDDVKKSYERYMEKYKDTQSSIVVKGFYNELKKNGFKRTDQVLEYVRKIEL